MARRSGEDAGDLAEHLRDRIVAKGVSVDVSPQVAKRGGPDTDYARNVAAQRVSAENPDRQAYEREWTAMRNRRDITLRELAAEYRAKTAIADPKEKKRLRREQRKAKAAIVDAHKPEDFGAWLQCKVERDEATLERLSALFQDRSAKIEREQPRRRGISDDDLAAAIERHRAQRANEERARENAEQALRRAAGIEPEAPKKLKGMRR